GARPWARARGAGALPPPSPAPRQSRAGPGPGSSAPAVPRSASTTSRESVSSGRPCTITRTVPGRRGSGTTVPITRRTPGSLSVAVIGRHDALRPHAEGLLHPVLDLRHQGGVVLEEELGVLAALADAL